jgi:hypothetical protein
MTLPDAIRGADRERWPFAHATVSIRQPAIVRSSAARNTSTLGAEKLAALEALAVAIETNQRVPEPSAHAGAPAAATADWAAFLEAERGALPAGDGALTWLSMTWWGCENYMYRLMCESVGYWSTGADIFESQKREALAQALPGFGRALGASAEQGFESLLLSSLWGNHVDLSLSGGVVDCGDVSKASALQGCPTASVLVDDTAACLALLRKSAGDLAYASHSIA